MNNGNLCILWTEISNSSRLIRLGVFFTITGVLDVYFKNKYGEKEYLKVLLTLSIELDSLLIFFK